MAVYTVERGDTLVDIARTIYGDPRRWRDVARLFGRDPETYGTRWAIQPGQTITAPADTPYAQQQAAAAPVPEPVAEPAPAPAEEVMVQPIPEGATAGGILSDPNATLGQVNAPAPGTSPIPEGAGTAGGMAVNAEPAAAPAPAPAPMEEPAGPTADQTSAFDLIKEALDLYGLGELTDFVNDLVFNQGIVTQAGLMTQVRQQDPYKRRFIGNAERLRQGLAPLSEPDYLDMERQLKNVMRDMGMPAGFYDEVEDLDQFIGFDVSADELQDRIEQGYRAIEQADPEVVGAMRRLYGVGDGELAAYFLDPTRAEDILLKQARTAQIAGQAERQAGMQIGIGLAEELERAGITEQQARAGFGLVSELGEVFQTTTEEAVAGQQAFTESEQAGAVFGTSPAAAQRLRQRQRQRQAAFESGGRFAGQGAEITGLR